MQIVTLKPKAVIAGYGYQFVVVKDQIGLMYFVVLLELVNRVY